jgi:hypothetical protein
MSVVDEVNSSDKTTTAESEDAEKWKREDSNRNQSRHGSGLGLNTC